MLGTGGFCLGGAAADLFRELSSPTPRDGVLITSLVPVVFVLLFLGIVVNSSPRFRPRAIALSLAIGALVGAAFVIMVGVWSNPQ